MGATKIPVTKSAYGYPLLIKQLLHLPLSNTPDQVIVYRDQVRQTYSEFGAKLRRSEVAVIGVKSAKWGETPLAPVVPKPGSDSLSEQDLREHMRDFAARGSISKFGIPAKFVFVEELEKTSVGTYDKKAMRARYDIVL